MARTTITNYNQPNTLGFKSFKMINYGWWRDAAGASKYGTGLDAGWVANHAAYTGDLDVVQDMGIKVLRFYLPMDNYYNVTNALTTQLNNVKTNLATFLDEMAARDIQAIIVLLDGTNIRTDATDLWDATHARWYALKDDITYRDRYIAGILSIVNALKGKSAVHTWQIANEPYHYNQDNDKVNTFLQYLYAQVKSADPDHYVTVGESIDTFGGNVAGGMYADATRATYLDSCTDYYPIHQYRDSGVLIADTITNPMNKPFIWEETGATTTGDHLNKYEYNSGAVENAWKNCIASQKYEGFSPWSIANMTIVNHIDATTHTYTPLGNWYKRLNADGKEGRSIATNRTAATNRAVRSAPIYGVKWLKVAGPTLERIDDAIGMVANAGVGSTPVTNDFDLADIYKDITEVTDVLGNVFIRIPKFYIKKCDGGGYKTWEISKQSFAGSYLPWCFWDFTNSVELDYVDVGKYTASLSGANKLQSIANTYPLINKNIVDFRTYAQANGAAYQQLDIHVVDILQILFIVEFATLNSQSIMNGFTAGQYNAAHTATVAENAVNRIIVANATAALYRVGQPISIGTSLGGNQIFYGRNITAIDVYDASNKAISFDGAAVNIAIGNILYNTGWKNGFSSGIAAKSGSLSSNSNGVNPFVYRGIENIFGNVWQFVDGVNINEYQAWICRNAASYASNVFASPYLQLSYINTNADGYPIEMGFDANNPFAHLSKTNGGSASTFYSDYYYRNTGQRIARFGGGWSNGSNAGLFCWDLGSASSAAYVAVSGRLLRKAL